MRNRLLDHFATATHRAYQTPITVRLAVLVDRGVPQIHRCDSPEQNRTALNPHQPGWLALHAKFRPTIPDDATSARKRRRNPSNSLQNRGEKSQRHLKLRKLG
jgi:hypothetical protein